jgi:DNA-binding response OmpR family regulator
MEMGADDYLTKPFGRLELLNAIETRLKKKTVKTFIKIIGEFGSPCFKKKNGLTELKKIISERKLGCSKKPDYSLGRPCHGYLPCVRQS